MQLKSVVRKPVYDLVAEQLRTAILVGELGPGSKLPTERELSKALGVSRTSVREALRQLQTQGLIAPTAGSTSARVVVAPDTAATGPISMTLGHLLDLHQVSLADLIDLRCALEGEAVRLAAVRSDSTLLAAARDALVDTQTPEIEVEPYDEGALRFHLALARSSGNRAIYIVMLSVSDAISRHMLATFRAMNQPSESIQQMILEHSSILDATVDGRAEKAAELMRAHIRGFYQRRVDSAGPDGQGVVASIG